MAGRKTLTLTDRQFETLGLLWEHGPLTVRELLALLPRGRDLPYTTVLGLLQNMEKAGLIAHDAEKKTHRYRPLVSQEQATRNLLADFVKRFFNDSAHRLVLSLVDTRQLSATDLREIEDKLAQQEKKSLEQPSQERPQHRRRKS